MDRPGFSKLVQIDRDRPSSMIRHMPSITLSSLHLPLHPTTSLDPSTPIRPRSIIEARPLLPLDRPRLSPIIETRILLSSVGLPATLLSPFGQEWSSDEPVDQSC